MGVKDRREREKMELKNKILDAANELFLELGYEKTTMRKIAERIEYNPATIYFYFKNKEEIFYALQKIAFQAFYEAFLKVYESTPNPSERLTKMGRAYIQFALENKSYYDLMFIMRQPMNAVKNSNWKVGEKNFEFLKATVKDCIEANILPDEDVDALAMMIWAGVHGVVSLVIRDRMMKFETFDIDFLVRQAFTLFDNFIQGKIKRSV